MSLPGGALIQLNFLYPVALSICPGPEGEERSRHLQECENNEGSSSCSAPPMAAPQVPQGCPAVLPSRRHPLTHGVAFPFAAPVNGFLPLTPLPLFCFWCFLHFLPVLSCSYPVLEIVPP